MAGLPKEKALLTIEKLGFRLAATANPPPVLEMNWQPSMAPVELV